MTLKCHNNDWWDFNNIENTKYMKQFPWTILSQRFNAGGNKTPLDWRTFKGYFQLPWYHNGPSNFNTLFSFWKFEWEAIFAIKRQRFSPHTSCSNHNPCCSISVFILSKGAVWSLKSLVWCSDLAAWSQIFSHHNFLKTKEFNKGFYPTSMFYFNKILNIPFKIFWSLCPTGGIHCVCLEQTCTQQVSANAHGR